MPTPGDQLPPDLGTLAREVADLKRQLRELRAGRRLESATVGAGGLGVARGGRLFMTTAVGTRMLDVGGITDANFNNPDGSQQQAHLLRRQDGSLALSVFGYGGSGQFVALWDAAGNLIAGDDANSGAGLARPYLPLPMGPASDTWDYWPRTTGTTMVELWSGLLYRQQPRLVVVVKTSMDTSGATGQVQLTLDGVVKAGPVNVGFGFQYTTFGPIDISNYGYMQQLAVAVAGKRVTGSGTIRASIYGAYTLQS